MKQASKCHAVRDLISPDFSEITANPRISAGKCEQAYQCAEAGNGAKPTGGWISYFDPCIKGEGWG